MTNQRLDVVPPLFQSQRQREIANLTQQHGRVEVSELSDRFGVTTETIRRDLSDLQTHGLVRRVHGGAVPWETAGFEPLVSVREDQQGEEKQRLAQAAVAELPDTGAIIIDSGSTLNRLCQAIPHDCTLRVVTNSLLGAQHLAEHAHLDVVILGGKVRKNTMAMVDAEAIAAVEPLTVDTLFISTDAASPQTGLTTPYREEASLKRAMINAARRVVVLVDYTKFGNDQFIRFAEWSDIDVLITNREIDPTMLADIEATGTTVVLT